MVGFSLLACWRPDRSSRAVEVICVGAQALVRIVCLDVCRVIRGPFDPTVFSTLGRPVWVWFCWAAMLWENRMVTLWAAF